MAGNKNNGNLPNISSASDDQFWKASVQLLEKRLQLIASNIANADTPNYKARDIDFKTALTQALAAPEKPAVSTPPPASSILNPVSSKLLYRTPYQSSIDGNTVEIDVEQTKFVDASIRYQFAFSQAIDEYKSISELFKNMT